MEFQNFCSFLVFDLFWLVHFHVTWKVPIFAAFWQFWLILALCSSCDLTSFKFFCKFLASSTYCGFIFTFMRPETFSNFVCKLLASSIFLCSFFTMYFSLEYVDVVTLNGRLPPNILYLLTSIWCTDGSQYAVFADLNMRWLWISTCFRLNVALVDVVVLHGWLPLNFLYLLT